MVDILSSLRTIWSPGAGAPNSHREFPRSAVLGFPIRLRRQRSKADLAKMIESEIIPRLMLAHSRVESADPDAGSVGPRTLDAFARMALSSESDTLTAYVETLIQGGLSLEKVYIELLVPTARRLGVQWEDDDISFTDVTIGLSRLHQVVRNLGRRFPVREAGPGAPAAYFAPVPGEQHTFGLCLLEDGFRRAGWRTWLDTSATGEDAVATVARDWFDIFGLSAAADAPLDVIAATIQQVRKASLNPQMFVMVGGRLFAGQPDLPVALGADAGAETVAEALSVADEAVKARVPV